jgi:energy-coupling factor transporter ATP-binding protein EcfA2
MSIEIKGENFQSWEQFNLTAADGELTVVVGPSNIGKSASVRALKGLIRNSLGAGQIRVGSKGIKIDATIDGKHIIAERGKKSSATYNIDGEDYSKLNRDVPQPIADLGMGLVEIGKQSLDATFAGQFDAQFILDRTAEELNTILGAFSSTEQLEFGKRTANGRIAEKNTEAKLLAKDKQRIAESTAKLEVLQEKADGIQGNIDKLEPDIDLGQQTIIGTETLVGRLQKSASLRKILDAVTVPETTHVAHGIQVTHATGRALEAVTGHRFIKSTLRRLKVPDTAPVVQGIQTGDALSRAIAARKVHNRVAGALSNLTVPSIVPALNSYKIAGYAKQLAAAQAKRERAASATGSIATCVTGWQGVAATAKLLKYLGEAETALFNRQNSEYARFIKKVDAHRSSVESLITEVKRIAAGIKGVDAVIQFREALEGSRKRKPALLEELKQAEALLEEVKAAYQEHQQALAVAAAKKAAEEELARTTRECPKCGEKVKIGEDHHG